MGKLQLLFRPSDIMRFLFLLSLLVAGASAATTGCGEAEPVECPSETHKYCPGPTDPETGCQESGWCLWCTSGLDSPTCICEPDFSVGTGPTGCEEPEPVECQEEGFKYYPHTDPETGCPDQGLCLNCCPSAEDC